MVEPEALPADGSFERKAVGGLGSETDENYAKTNNLAHMRNLGPEFTQNCTQTDRLERLSSLGPEIVASVYPWVRNYSKWFRS